MIIIFVFCRLENNLEEFRLRVKNCVKESLNHVYDTPEIDDAHYIKFSVWNPKIHEPIRRKIYEQKVIIHKYFNL